MASVADLVTDICDDAGLDNTSGSDDRVAVIRRLNDAYRQICRRAVRRHSSVDHTPAAGTTDVDLTTVTTLQDNFLAVDRIQVIKSDGSLTKPITNLPNRKLFDGRTTETSTPGAYSYEWPYLRLSCPMDGTEQLRIHYVIGPPALVESGAGANQETTPTHITPAWHEELLAGLAICLVLERREGMEERASYHRGLFQTAMIEFTEFQNRESGKTAATDNVAVNAFNTPDRLRIR